MIQGVIDSTIIIHLYRKNLNAVAWLREQQVRHYATSITWIEIMRGVQNKQSVARNQWLLEQFNLIHLTSSDQDWAIEQMMLLRLSKGVGSNDCLIASVAHRLQVPIYTHNVKDFLKLLPAHLVIQPYTE
jgi:predicted nucleic acid-binding protein